MCYKSIQRYILIGTKVDCWNTQFALKLLKNDRKNKIKQILV